MKAIDINGKLHDVSIDELTWRPSVYGIVIEHGTILLSPQHSFGYDLPGGGVNLGESIEAALVREVKEETGIDVQPISLLTAKDNIFVWKPDDVEKRRVFHSVLLYYSCKTTDGEISSDGLEGDEKEYASEAVWLDIDRLDDISPASSYDWRQVVQEYLRVN
ncbi:NUDIX domain-containing protein [Candidatus Saccharibacteria bacterium]|nr:NUDIX domain-containing protein [Candidatus Saccharibacteria bacterium]